jgi:hypothetical protein
MTSRTHHGWPEPGGILAFLPWMHAPPPLPCLALRRIALASFGIVVAYLAVLAATADYSYFIFVSPLQILPVERHPSLSTFPIQALGLSDRPRLNFVQISAALVCVILKFY